MIDKDYTSDAKSCEYDAVYPEDSSNTALQGIALKIKNSIKKKCIFCLLFLVFFNYLYAQTDEKVLNKILFDIFEDKGASPDTILLKVAKIKTYLEYDSLSFDSILGLTIPTHIIAEWKKNEENMNYAGMWNEKSLNSKDTIISGTDTLFCKKPVFKCLSENDINQLFERTKRRQKIYEVSKLLFDNSRENVLLHITVLARPGNFFSETVLIKRVFGKWVIVAKFDFLMS